MRSLIFEEKIRRLSDAQLDSNFRQGCAYVTINEPKPLQVETLQSGVCE
jgi:hypothetical protein